MSDLNQKYIVLALRPNGATKYFSKVISCEYNAIVRYVESLQFASEVELYFFPIDLLNSKDVMDTLSEEVSTLYMHNNKSMSEFRNEVDALCDKLQIKIDKEEENE